MLGLKHHRNRCLTIIFTLFARKSQLRHRKRCLLNISFENQQRKLESDSTRNLMQNSRLPLIIHEDPRLNLLVSSPFFALNCVSFDKTPARDINTKLLISTQLLSSPAVAMGLLNNQTATENNLFTASLKDCYLSVPVHLSRILSKIKGWRRESCKLEILWTKKFLAIQIKLLLIFIIQHFVKKFT